MANQAAKKAAKAKQSASNVYKPALCVVNIVYGYAYIIRKWEEYSSSWYNIIGSILMFGLTGYAYVSILEASSMANRSNKGFMGESSGIQALAGGFSLDLLGLVVVVQFGTAFISSSFYWLLIVLPIYALYKGYGLMSGFMGGGGESGIKHVDNEASKARRQKRAEKRRQKWN